MTTCAALCHAARARFAGLIVISCGVFGACGGDSKDSHDGSRANAGSTTRAHAGAGAGGHAASGAASGRGGSSGASSGQGGGNAAQGGDTAAGSSGLAGSSGVGASSGRDGSGGTAGAYTSCPPSMAQNAPCSGSFRCDYPMMCTACGCCSTTLGCVDGKLAFLGSSDGCLQCPSTGGAGGMSGRGGAGATGGGAAGEGGAPN